MADEIELPPYPYTMGQTAAKQLANSRGRLTSQMQALDDELLEASRVLQSALDEADSRRTTQDRIAALAKTKRPNR